MTAKDLQHFVSGRPHRLKMNTADPSAMAQNVTVDIREGGSDLNTKVSRPAMTIRNTYRMTNLMMT